MPRLPKPEPGQWRDPPAQMRPGEWTVRASGDWEHRFDVAGPTREGGALTRSFTAALLMVVALLVGACTGQVSTSASPAPAAASAPASIPGRTVVPSLALPATPTGPGSPAPVRPPAPIASPTVVAGELVLRLVTYPDVYAAPIPPDLSVYSDGTVLTQGWRSPGFEGVRFVVRHLNHAGLAQVAKAFSLAVPREGVLGAIPSAGPGTGGGYSTYVVSGRRAGQLVTARTTNASVGPGARELVTFAERWRDVASVLARDEWLDGTPVAYVPERWSAFVSASPDCCSEPGRPDASLLVPILGPPDLFGTVVQAASPSIRCGVLDASTRDAFAGILRRTGVDIGNGRDRTDFTLNLGTGMVSLIVVPNLPDDRSGCSLEIG